MNYWFWLFIILIPIIVFSVRPEANLWRRMGRLVLAIGAGYVLANVALHWSRSLKWEAYEACQSQFPDGAIQHHEECPEINIADGASNVFYLLFGWVPAAAYIGGGLSHEKIRPLFAACAARTLLPSRVCQI